MSDAAVGLELEPHVQKELSRLRLPLLARRMQQLMEDRHHQLAHRFTENKQNKT